MWHSSTRRADKSYFSQLTDWRTPVVVLLRLLQQSNPIARSRKLKGSWFKDYIFHTAKRNNFPLLFGYTRKHFGGKQIWWAVKSLEAIFMLIRTFKISIEPPSQMLSSEFTNHAPSAACFSLSFFCMLFPKSKSWLVFFSDFFRFHRICAKNSVIDPYFEHML